MVINNYYTVATVIKPTVHIVLSHSQGTNTLCSSVLEKATSNRSCIEFTRIEISKDKHFIHILYVVYHNYYCVTFSFFVGYGSFSRRLTISCLAICHVLFYCYQYSLSHVFYQDFKIHNFSVTFHSVKTTCDKILYNYIRYDSLCSHILL